MRSILSASLAASGSVNAMNPETVSSSKMDAAESMRIAQRSVGAILGGQRSLRVQSAGERKQSVVKGSAMKLRSFPS